MDGVKLFSDDMLDGASTEQDKVQIIKADLKQNLEGIATTLFGDVEMRWVDAYFPFTTVPTSMELEIYFQDDWLEVLGCGGEFQEV